ncbi:MAG TPA: Uma2 family endonuclease, partial [Polyangia bacterium]
MSRHPRFPSRPRGRPATWEDLDEVPESHVGEIIAGAIVATPRPDPPHMKAAGDLRLLLGGPFRLGVGGPGGWILYEEPRIRFGEDIRVPDLGGWRKERWGTPPRTGPLTVIPAWICEVLSRSTEAEDRAVKLPLYARAKVGHVWLISPDARTLEIYRLKADGWLLCATHAGDVRVRAAPFDAVELDLSLLWLPPEPE